MTVRTRFAPSPTGYLHVGGARTALYSWLFARKHGGKFILRIEDTDQARSTDESIEAILQAMQWLGLDYDEGPFYQMQRLARYQEIAESLIAKGAAYRCNCSKERLEKLRESQIAAKQKPRYDGHCRGAKLTSDTTACVIRFHNPVQGTVSFNDSVHGAIHIQNSELDDFVLTRTDGVPTYNFSVVVDDIDMQITHVIRGDDHINNTPKQINLYQALGETIPQYAHIPMVLGNDGKRMSKRHGAVSVMQYQEMGYLPQALLNYLVRLGWSHGDQEIFSLTELTKLFSLDAIHKSAAGFDTNKLTWLNQHYLKTLPVSALVKPLADQLATIPITCQDDERLSAMVEALRERAKTLAEMAQMSICFFQFDGQYDESAVKKHWQDDSQAIIEYCLTELAQLVKWEVVTIHHVIAKCVEHFQVKFPKVAQPLRIALTGNTISPSIDATMHLIGKTACLERLQMAIQKLGTPTK